MTWSPRYNTPSRSKMTRSYWETSSLTAARLRLGGLVGVFLHGLGDRGVVLVVLVGFLGRLGREVVGFGLDVVDFVFLVVVFLVLVVLILVVVVIVVVVVLVVVLGYRVDVVLVFFTVVRV